MSAQEVMDQHEAEIKNQFGKPSDFASQTGSVSVLF